MVQIRRIPEGYIERPHGLDVHHPGNEVIYEDEASSFRGLSLCDLTIEYANLDGYDLRGADFSRAKLSCSAIRGAQLDGARFFHADMLGCRLTGAVLGDADFTGASLCGADFSDCDMSDARFEGAHLELSFYSTSTVWPAGVNLDAVGSRRKDLWEALNAERQRLWEEKHHKG